MVFSPPRPTLLAAILALAASDVGSEAQPSPTRAAVRFEPNLGQAPQGVLFQARSGSSLVWLGSEAIEFHARPPSPRAHGALRGAGEPPAPVATVRLTLVGGRLTDAVAEDLQASISNYFIGPDRSRWRRAVPNYGRVAYKAVYPGIDLAFHAQQGALEYDFIVAPGADPAAIEMRFEGQRGLRRSAAGELVLETPVGDMRQPRPVAFQEGADGARHDVAAEFEVRPGGRVGLALGPFDRDRPVIIDPQVLWSTGTPSEGWKIAAAPDGHTYSVGQADGDLVLAGLDASGGLAWTSYFGGGNPDSGEDVALGPDGSVYVTGWTASDWSGLPPGGFSAGLPPGTPSGTGGAAAGKVLLLRFGQQDGELLFFTWFGGTDGLGSPPNEQSSQDDGRGIAVDSQGYVYLTGGTSSDGFPVLNAVLPTPNPQGVNTSNQGWAAKLDPAMQTLVYSTYLRGSLVGETSVGLDVAPDAWGNGHVVGDTDSNDFITSGGAADSSNPAWNLSGFVTKLGPTGALLYSTYLGGDHGSDEAVGVAIDALGRACVTGRTGSDDFPRSMPPALSGWRDAFIACLSVDGTSIPYGRYVGGLQQDSGDALVVAPDHTFYVVGSSYSASGTDVDQLIAHRTLDGQGEWNFIDGTGGPDQAWGGAMDAAGHLYTSGQYNGVPGVVRQLGVCGGAVLEDSCGPELEILPSTTRAKPQRSDEAVDIHFLGPSDLVTATIVADLLLPEASGALSVTGFVLPEPAGGACLPAPSEACYVMVWVGPWTYSGPQGPNTRLPAGRYVMTLRGEAGSAPARQVSSTQYSRFALVEVANVRFEPEMAGAELGENPNAGGGKAAYVDAPAPGLDYRRNVRVVARVTPLMGADGEGLYVIHRWLDVDDPSAATAPIDDEPHASQQCSLPGGVTVVGACDNSGQPPGPLLGSPVDALGQSESIMTLSTRQGDNYRVVASTDNEWAMGFRPLPGPNADGAVEHGSGEPQGVVAPLVSPLLTVWRTLHIESDYLAPSEPQSLWDRNGKVQSVSPTKITAEGPALRDAEHAGKGKWQGAELTPDVSHPTTWIEATGSTDSTVTVSSANDLTTLTQPGIEFRVSDDKWVDLAQPFPFGLLRDVMARAYVDVKLASNNSLVAHPWVKYFGAQEAWALPRDVPSSDPYWSVLAVVAFDYASSGNGFDNDPDIEESTLGTTTCSGSAQNLSQPVSSIYLETSRDMFSERGATASNRFERVMTHEILCHGMYFGHQDGNLCQAGYTDDPAGEALSEDQVAFLRARTAPRLCPDNYPCLN